MNRKIKRLSILVFSMVLSVFFNTNMLSAKEIDVPVHSQQRACEAGTMYPIPDKGEVILQASTCDYQVASIDFRTVSGQVHRIIFDQRNAYWNAIGTNIKTSWYNESSQAQLWTVNPA